MILIDIGNSRLKWSELAGTLTPPQFEAHDGDIGGAIGRLALPNTDAVWVASVLGADHDAAIAAALAAAGAPAPRFARVEQGLEGLHVAYAEPSRLGVDRWLTMLGLWRATRAPFCVASAGTALTFDAVNDAGEHLGGFIAPGLTTAQKAVDAHTRFTIRPGRAQFGTGLGQDTESCVRQGALYACAGAVERASRNLPGTKFLTGGDAATLLPHLGKGWEWKPNAVLEGLAVLANR